MCAQRRPVDQAVRAGVRRKPRWVAIRQTKFAIRCRALLYGRDARPLGRIMRQNWVRLLAFYTRSRMLRYGEALGIAIDLGAELRAAGEVLLPDEQTDQRLRDLLSQRLTAAARQKEAERGPADALQLLRRKLELQAAWAEQWSKECLLLGVCPTCGDDLPCDGCEVPAVEIDGRGGLRAKAGSR